MKTIIVALLMVFATSPALAVRFDSRAPKGYIGFSKGQDATDLPSTATVSNTSSAFSAFAGYSFNDYLAGELVYTNFGSQELVLNSTLKSNAGSLILVGSIPLGIYVSLFGKVGYAYTTTELFLGNVTSTTAGKNDATYGAGIQFNVVRQRIGIRLGYDNYKILLGTDTYNSNYMSLSLVFKF